MVVCHAPRLYSLDLVDSYDRLRELYSLDLEAYRDASIEFSTFARWWEIYDLGLRVVLFEGKIVGAIGIWGLDVTTVRRFIAGGIAEEDIQPMSHEQLEAAGGTAFWYISGLLIVPERRKMLNSPLRMLLTGGINSVIKSAHMKYPANFYALGYSQDGLSLLKSLGFEEIKSSDEMRDAQPLYWIAAENLMKVRGSIERSGVC